MSVLNDSTIKSRGLLAEADRQLRAYTTAKDALVQIEELCSISCNNSHIDLGMQLLLNDVQIPMPVNDLSAVREILIASMNFLGHQLARTWQELGTTACQTAVYCNEQIQAAMLPETSPEAAIVPVSQAPVVNVPQIPANPPVSVPVQPQVQPRVRQFTTTPIQ